MALHLFPIMTLRSFQVPEDLSHSKTDSTKTVLLGCNLSIMYVYMDAHIFGRTRPAYGYDPEAFSGQVNVLTKSLGGKRRLDGSLGI